MFLLLVLNVVHILWTNNLKSHSYPAMALFSCKYINYGVYIMYFKLFYFKLCLAPFMSHIDVAMVRRYGLQIEFVDSYRSARRGGMEFHPAVSYALGEWDL